MLEDRTSHQLTAAQLGAIWLAGVAAVPMAIPFLAVAAMTNNVTMLLLIVVALGISIFAFLYALVKLTCGVSALGVTAAGRLLWALLVLGGGVAGWALGIAVNNKVRLAFLTSGVGICAAAGVPFVLTAGLLLRNRWHRLVALGLVLVLVGASVAILRHESPAAFKDRLATAGIHRDTRYVVGIPATLHRR